MTNAAAIPKIYHIIHVDRLESITKCGGMVSDSRMQGTSGVGTNIGLSHIKQRRLSLPLASHSGLYVGQCVPFYFCPRSVMLYLIAQRNVDLAYQGGQSEILHLEADLQKTVSWANSSGKRWAFTTSNAGSFYFDDYNDLNHLSKIDWAAVNATDWRGKKEGKQAEFLVEDGFPWTLVEKIGIMDNAALAAKVQKIISTCAHKPVVQYRQDWYY